MGFFGKLFKKRVWNLEYTITSELSYYRRSIRSGEALIHTPIVIYFEKSDDGKRRFIIDGLNSGIEQFRPAIEAKWALRSWQDHGFIHEDAVKRT